MLEKEVEVMIDVYRSGGGCLVAVGGCLVAELVAPRLPSGCGSHEQ